MANSDKNIKITPNISQAAQPNVVFTGQGNVPITLKVLDDSYGTLSFEGSAGQLFSINNNLTTGVIFSVNDVSGIPQIDVNANGTISLVPFGGVVGVGTSSPQSTSPGVDITADASSQLTGQLMIKRASTNDRFRLTCGMHTGNYGFIQAYENAIGGLVLALQPSSGTVGIGTTAPGAKLQIDTTAAATKGLIVKGFTSQSANLTEWQNSAGTALGYVTASGNISFPRGNFGSEAFGDSATASGVTATAVGRSASATGSDSVALGFFSAASSSSTVALGKSASASASNAIAIGSSVSNSTANSVAIGASSNTLNAFYGTLRTYMPSATTTGAIIRGFTSQSANLTEWQNSAGTVLSSIDSSGNASFPAASITTTTTTLINSNYTHRKSFIRTLPNTIGNYVEITRYNEYSHSTFRVHVTLGHNAGEGAMTKSYLFVGYFGFGGTLPPNSQSGASDTTNECELEIFREAAGSSVLRLRRSKGTSSATASILIEQIYSAGGAGSGSYSLEERTGTGTSNVTTSYTTDSAGSTRLQPNMVACNPPGSSGAGTSVALSAGTAIGTGAGGSFTIAAGSGAGTANGGSVVIQAGNYATSGSGGSISLIPKVSSGDSSSSAVTMGYLNYYTPCHHTFERTIPNTVGDYVELFAINAGNSVWIELEVLVWKHAESYGSKAYKFSGLYAQSGIIQPIGNGIENHGYAGFFYNIFELEITDANPQVVRLRRSAAGGTGVTAYVYVRSQSTGLVEKTGTGTSAISLSSLHYTHLTYPTLITPMPVTGGSGAGYSLTLKARDGATSGAGGSIILQPGAQASTGGNGVVIVRQPGGTAGTDEGQISHNGAHLTIQNKDGGTSSGVFITETSGYGIYVYRDTGLSIINAATGTLTLAYQASVNLSYWSVSGSTGAFWTFNDAYRLYWPGSGLLSNAGAILSITGGSSSGTSNGGSLAFASSSPSAYTANQNDLVLTGSAFQRLSGTAARDITGVAPPSGGSHVDGRMMRIYNIGSFNLTLKHNSTSSASANRFFCVQSADIVIATNDFAELIYDSTNNGSGAAGWRVA